MHCTLPYSKMWQVVETTGGHLLQLDFVGIYKSFVLGKVNE